MKNKYAVLLILFVILILTSLFSLSVGGSNIQLSEIVRTLFSKGSSDTMSMIIWNIRLPRVVLGVFTGMGLAAVGCVFQGLLRNPLADPYTLGISGGAGVWSHACHCNGHRRCIGILAPSLRVPRVACLLLCRVLHCFTEEFLGYFAYTHRHNIRLHILICSFANTGAGEPR